MAEEIKKVLTIEADTSQAEQALDGVKDKLEEVQESAEKVDIVEQFANATKVAAGVVGAFNSVKGAMTLLGVESENVDKAIQKMQAGMAMVQGFQAIAEGAKSFKTLKAGIDTATKGMSGFKKALIGTGIGAIVVLIGELIAHFDDLDKLTGGKLSKTLSGLGGVIGNLGNEVKALGNLLLSALLAPIKTVIEGVTGLGKILKAVFKGEWDSIGGIAKETANNIKGNFEDVGDAARAVGQEFSKGFQEGIESDATKKAQKAWEEWATKTNEELDRQASKAKATINDELELNKKLLEIEKKRLNTKKKGSKEYYDQLKNVHDLENTIAKIQDDLVAAGQGEVLSLEEQINRSYQRSLLELAQSSRNYEEYVKGKELLDEQWNIQQQSIYSDLLESEKLKLSTMTDATEAEVQAVEKRIAEIESILAKLRSEELQLDSKRDSDDEAARQKKEEEAARKIQEEEEERIKNYYALGDAMNSVQDALSQMGANSAWGDIISRISDIAYSWNDLSKAFASGGTAAASAAAQMAAVGFSAISSMMSGLIDEENNNTKEGFEQNKKYQIAAATMSMLSGIASAWSSALSPMNDWMTLPGQIAMGTVMSALMGTVGGMQIAKIKQQSFEGGGSDTSSASASINTAALSAAMSPTQTAGILTGYSSDASLEDQRVYVVESDITNSQRKVAVDESESTF